MFKHFPLDFIHSNSRKAAEAAECAGDQNKFWEYHDYLFSHVSEWESGKDEVLIGIFTNEAKNLGLNFLEFQQCLESGIKAPVVQMNKQEGQNLFVSGTPTLIVNSHTIITDDSIEGMSKFIRSELDKQAYGKK